MAISLSPPMGSRMDWSDVREYVLVVQIPPLSGQESLEISSGGYFTPEKNPKGALIRVKIARAPWTHDEMRPDYIPVNT